MYTALAPTFSAPQHLGPMIKLVKKMTNLKIAYTYQIEKA